MNTSWAIPVSFLNKTFNSTPTFSQKGCHGCEGLALTEAFQVLFTVENALHVLLYLILLGAGVIIVPFGK